jgi:hypothetical protein
MHERLGKVSPLSEFLTKVNEIHNLYNEKSAVTGDKFLLSDKEFVDREIDDLARKFSDTYYGLQIRPNQAPIDYHLKDQSIQQKLIFCTKEHKDFYLNQAIEVGLVARKLTNRQTELVADLMLTRDLDKLRERDFYAHQRYIAREILLVLRNSNQFASTALTLERQLAKLELPVRLLSLEEKSKLESNISELLPNTFIWKKSLELILNEAIHPENREFLIDLLKVDFAKVQKVEKDFFTALSFSTNNFHKNVLIELNKTVQKINGPFDSDINWDSIERLS